MLECKRLGNKRLRRLLQQQRHVLLRKLKGLRKKERDKKPKQLKKLLPVPPTLLESKFKKKRKKSKLSQKLKQSLKSS